MPYSSPPADCLIVLTVGREAVSDFAGSLYDPSVELRSERPEQDGSKLLTCYGAYTGSQGTAGDGVSANTVFITLRVDQPGASGDGDVVEQTRRSFTSYRDEHTSAVKILPDLGDDAYSYREVADRDVAVNVDFRKGNATMHIRLNRSHAGAPLPHQETSVESDALTLARALADNLDSLLS
ncbi:hypothetical protein ACFO5K_12790 [Nocardia halotolerans]|uniref:Lipoprotein n=1 Tax=Nocardia halotolerans TaxID=1755878 RepID=A0ABV8VHM9_9NOCA